MDYIIFVGGIHGVEKSTVCSQLCLASNIIHLSANDLIKWEEINENPKNKKVLDIDNTQQRLLRGLKENVKSNRNYLLDGHFCLLDKEAKVSKIPLTVF